jgi:hypothetical protein
MKYLFLIFILSGTVPEKPITTIVLETITENGVTQTYKVITVKAL